MAGFETPIRRARPTRILVRVKNKAADSTNLYHPSANSHKHRGGCEPLIRSALDYSRICAGRSFAHFLNCRKQQSNEDCNDGDDNEKLDESKRFPRFDGETFSSNHGKNSFDRKKKNIRAFDIMVFGECLQLQIGLDVSKQEEMM